MTDSILDSIKGVLNISPDDSAFDQDIILHINSVLGTLNQLGVGPSQGFMITNSATTWDTFLGSDALRLNMVKSYVYLRVRLLFDPPPTGFGTKAIEEQIKEAAWRINEQQEEGRCREPEIPLQSTMME